MRCSRCHRELTKAAVTSGGVALGPTCARLMGITTGKRVAAPVPQEGQLPLFQAEQVTS